MQIEKSIGAGAAVLAVGLVCLSPALTDSPRPSGPQTSGPVDETQESPLSNYLGFGYHPEQEEQMFAEEEGRRQALIQSCMREAGFDYWQRPLSLDEVPAPGEKRLRDGVSASRELLPC